MKNTYRVVPFSEKLDIWQLQVADGEHWTPLLVAGKTSCEGSQRGYEKSESEAEKSHDLPESVQKIA